MPASDDERLMLRMEVTVRKFEKQLAQSNRAANKHARAIENRFLKMNKNISRSFRNSLRGALPAVGAGILAREFKQLSDASIRIENSLKVAGLEGEALSTIFDSLFASAQRNFAPLETLVSLYSSTAQAQSELNVTTEEMVRFTDNVAIALRVSGKSAAASRGALIQLSQAIGAGIVRAEEFNAILEGARPIAQAAAAGLKEAGGSVAKLRTLIIDGKVSSEAFFRAFEAGAPILAEKLDSAVVNSEQALVRLQNALIKSVGKFDDASGASGDFVDAINSIADNADGFFTWMGKAYNYLDDLAAKFEKVKVVASSFGEIIGRETGLNKVGEWLSETWVGENLGIKSTLVEKRRTNGLDAKDPRKLDVNGFSTPGSAPVKPKTEVDPVSLRDFKSPTSKKKKRSKKTSGQVFADDIERIKARTAAIKAETAAQAGINPLIDDYGFAVEKASIQQELLNEAKKAGVKITPELKAQINELATGYALASSEALRLAESQDEIRERAEEFKSFRKDMVKGFISDVKSNLREGQKGWDAFANAGLSALEKIANKLEEIALDKLFDNAFGSEGGKSGGGLLSSIFSAFGGGDNVSATNWNPMMGPLPSFEGGGFTGHGSRTGGVDGRGGFLAINHPNETMIDHTKGFRMPSTPTPSNNNQPQQVIVRVVASSEFEAMVQTTSANVSAQIVRAASPTIINQAVAKGQKNAVDGGLDGIMSARYSAPAKTVAR